MRSTAGFIVAVLSCLVGCLAEPSPLALEAAAQGDTVATCPPGQSEVLSEHPVGSAHSTSQATCWSVARAEYNLAVATFNVDCARQLGTAIHADASESESMSHDHYICIKVSHAVCCKPNPDAGVADARPVDTGSLGVETPLLDPQ